MPAYTFRMPTGIAGGVTRMDGFLAEPSLVQPAGQTGAPTEFGVPMVIDAVTGRARLPATGDAADDIHGFLVRAYPTQGGQADQLATGTPPASGPIDLMRRGYMNVRLRSGTAVRGGNIHVRIASPLAQRPIGGIEAAADGVNTVLLPAQMCYFMTPADADGNVEIAFRV